jgi:hypothetical protein
MIQNHDYSSQQFTLDVPRMGVTMAVLAIKNHENPWRFPARPKLRQNASRRTRW